MTLLADRGFADHKFCALLADVAFDFVVRIPEQAQIRDADREAKCGGFWVMPGGRTRMLKNARVTEKELPIGAFVCERKPKMKEP